MQLKPVLKKVVGIGSRRQVEGLNCHITKNYADQTLWSFKNLLYVK
jgi:hypothetical protein